MKRPVILIVDDDPAMRRLVAYVVEPLNVDIIAASDAESALTIAQVSRPDLILVDLNLPGMDGFGLIQQIRGLAGFESVPVVVLTARNHPGDLARAEEVGTVGFLYKPFSTQELQSTLRRQLNLGNT